MARLGVAVLALLVAAAVAVAFLPAPVSAGAADLDAVVVSRALSSKAPCDGALVGECGVDEEEEMGMAGGASDTLRRSLLRKPTNRYISYAALRADQVPCNKRGRSYYNNCASQRQANPYQRGCSAITRCSRNMN